VDEFPNWIDLVSLGPLLIQAAFWFVRIQQRRTDGHFKKKAAPAFRGREVTTAVAAT
jgi:hypothetical protein